MSFRHLPFIIILFLPFGIKAQDPDLLIEKILEDIAESREEEIDLEELSERLNYYKKFPININKTNREQLRELYFLSPIQIDQLLNHIKDTGSILEIYELQSIEGFNLETAKLLSLFCIIKPKNEFENFSVRNMFKNGKSDLMLRYGRGIELQRGFTIPKDSDKSRYLGPPDKMYTRYRFYFQNNIQFSLNIEKDAGEYFWNTSGQNKGPDFISTSLYLRNLSSIEKLVIGDYSLQFGQGITLWSGLAFGKGTDIISTVKQDLGLRPYTSFTEYSFFRGIAAQTTIKKLKITPFFSTKFVDASTDIDHEGNLLVNNLQYTGLHRTPNELQNKNAIRQTVAGSHIELDHKWANIGFTFYHTGFNNNFSQSDLLYKRFSFTGSSLINSGINYSKTYKNFYFFGEASRSIPGGFAFLNGVLSSLSNKLSLIVLHRNYNKDFHNFFSQAIGENTRTENEKGLYSGFNYQVNKHYEFSFYADAFKFPWLKFGVDAPSKGYDIQGQFNYTPSKQLKVQLKYRLKEKEQNILDIKTNALEYYRRQNYRLEIQYQIRPEMTLKNRAEVSQYKTSSTANRFGFLAFQDITYSKKRARLSGNIRYVIFDTDGYDTRIYTYENDVLFGYSIPGFQNKGIRFYLNTRYKVNKKIDLWMKYSLTRYRDTELIGSGLDEIAGNRKSDIRLQLRYLF